MPRTRRRVLSLSLSLTASILPVYLIAAIAPELQDAFHVGSGAFGLLNALSFLAWSVSSLVLGRRVDRTGGTPVLIASIGTLAVGLLAIAGSATWPQLLAAVAVCGLAGGAIPQAGYRAVWDSVSSARKGFAFGIVQAGFPAATVLTGAAAPWLTSVIGWRPVFVGSAVLVLTVGLVVRHAARSSHAASGPASVASPAPPTAGGARRGGRGERSRAMPLLLTASVIANGATAGLTTYLVLALVHSGVSDVAAGRLFAAAGLAAIATRLLAGRLVDAASVDPLRVMGGLLLGGAAGVAAMTSGIASVVAVGAVVGVGIGWGWSGVFAYAIVHTFADRPGAASGLVMTVAGGLGSATGPLLIGLVASQAGYRWAELGIICALCAAAAVILAIVQRIRLPNCPGGRQAMTRASRHANSADPASPSGRWPLRPGTRARH